MGMEVKEDPLVKARRIVDGMRQSVIAERIEKHQSAAVWVSMAEQGVLAFAD